MQKYYKILNVDPNCTDEQLEIAYNTLKNKYKEERFLEGDLGNKAAKNLTELENAYAEIINERKSQKTDGEKKVEDFSNVEALIRQGDIAGAQQLLDNVTDRSAEWHYLQSVIFYKKNWSNESKKQLEIAMNMDPKNNKYANAYVKLKEKMAYNDSQFRSGNATNTQNVNEQPQMGGTNECCNFCAQLCCMNLMCNMCCR